MTSKVLLHSAIAAVIGGAATGASTALATSPINWRAVGGAALAGALASVAALLKQSPREGSDSTDQQKGK